MECQKKASMNVRLVSVWNLNVMQVLNNMTQDDQKVCVHCFVLKCNVSACNQDLSSKTEQAWITVCGHIFCASCGLAELGNLPIICPICSHMLTSPFDILKAELNPPSHFIKVVSFSITSLDVLICHFSPLSPWALLCEFIQIQKDYYSSKYCSST